MVAASAPPAAAELIARIGWLIRLRWLALVGAAGVVVLVVRSLGIPLPLTPIFTVLGGLALYNLLLEAVMTRLRREQAGGVGERGFLAQVPIVLALVPVWLLGAWLWAQSLARSVVMRALGRQVPGAREWRRGSLARLLVPRALWGMEQAWDTYHAAALASAQISLDLIALAALVHFAGGIENSFTYFFVFHVIISGMLLSRRATYVQATLGFALVAGVALGEYFGVLKHYPIGALSTHGDYRDPTFVGAQLFVVGATLYLSAYMAGSIAARLRFRERETVLLSREVAAKATMIEDAFAKLKRTEQAKSQYMRKVAHELRGPLGTIQTALRTVLGGLTGPVPAPSQDLLSRAERRAGELAQVTVDLLALARAKEGQLAIEREPVDLAALLAELGAEMQAPAREGGIVLAIEAAGPVVLHGDRAGLRQMIGNLLSNAVRYTPRGGTVTACLAVGETELRIVVEDAGIGIPAEDLPRIFDEFFRSSNARNHAPQGTGLGLAIVKAVAEQHRGQVSVTSEPGRGSRFVVVFPLP